MIVVRNVDKKKKLKTVEIKIIIEVRETVVDTVDINRIVWVRYENGN